MAHGLIILLTTDDRLLISPLGQKLEEKNRTNRHWHPSDNNHLPRDIQENQDQKIEILVELVQKYDALRKTLFS